MKMKPSYVLLAAVLASSAATLIGCARYGPPAPYEPEPILAAAPSAQCGGCGTITSINSAGTTADMAYQDGEYEVTVRLDSGGMKTITQSSQPAFQVGDRVQILSRPTQ